MALFLGLHNSGQYPHAIEEELEFLMAAIQTAFNHQATNLKVSGTATLGDGSQAAVHELKGSSSVTLQFQRTSAPAQTWALHLNTDGTFRIVDTTDSDAAAVTVAKGTQGVT